MTEIFVSHVQSALRPALLDYGSVQHPAIVSRKARCALRLRSAFYIAHGIDWVQSKTSTVCSSSTTKGGNPGGCISLSNSTTYSLVSDASLGPEPQSSSLSAPGCLVSAHSVCPRISPPQLSTSRSYSEVPVACTSVC